MTRRMLALYLTLTALAALLAGVASATPFGEICYFGAYLVMCALVTRSALARRRSGERFPWLYVAFGQLAWLAGDSVYPMTTYVLHGTDDGVIEAVLWTFGYLAYGAALVGMARRRAGRWLRPAVLDMLTLATAVAIVIWVVFISPFLADAAADPLGAYLYVMGPLGDIVILAGVLLLILSPGTRTGATRLLVLSAVLRIASDLGTTFIPSEHLAMAVGTGVILLSNGLLVAAALHPGSEELTAAARRAPTLHPARIWFLGVALLTAPVVFFSRTDYAEAERIMLFAATLTTTGLVLARFASALRSLERAERQLSFQVRHDPLTGLANRAALSEALEASPPGTTLLYLDLDGFKEVNDTAGHSGGDAILQAVAQRLRAAVRDADTVARLGGDEFAVVLTGLGSGDAIRTADRILRDVAMPIEHEGAWYTVGASIGIAGTADSDSGSSWRPAALLRAADTAMYSAKRMGRGRWILAEAAS
ncbi:diguanylate cyclase domain-containing protein [Actinoplanes sp. NPDC049681]|uniref:diguanylate cyclase domain-containing protein n=1 Tax=Actinoplanes sp. NPDC049681 TaxID=3363905 RepID=UPI00379CFC6C